MKGGQRLPGHAAHRERGWPSPDDRRDVVPGAVLGDGSLLLTLSRRGEVEQLWWPHVDRDPNLGELRLAVVGDDVGTWLDDPDLAHEQRYDGDTDVLVTEVAGVAGGTVTITDAVATDAPVLVRRVAGTGGRVGMFVRPELHGTDRAGGGYVQPDGPILVFHRRDRVLAVGADVASRVAVGERHRGDRADLGLLSGQLRDRGVVHGTVDGALLTLSSRDEVTIAVAMADDHATAVVRVRDTLAAGAAEVAAARRSASAAIVAAASEPLVRGDAARLDARSQLVLRHAADRATGAVIAAPEADPAFVRSGGYGFVWARDLAFILLAQLAAGRSELAVPALRWLARAQSPDGLWLQRHWTDGTLGPSWGTQLDETGAAVVTYEIAWQVLGDTALDAELWPSARAAADALVAVLDPATDLPAPSLDLWEERFGIHTYTAAATAAGLDAAAAMAQRHAPELAQPWRAAAARVREAILIHLWSDEHGCFLRSLHVAREDDRGSPPPAAYALLDHPGPPVGSVDPVDAVVDVCLLGLVYPFAILSADDPRMAATLEAVQRSLWAHDGGMRRYVGDDYEGGNPWVLATLWSGLATRRPGANQPAEGVDYALRVATPTGLLPEQVDAATGEPAWIAPLTWSHAMYVLAVRPDPPGLQPSSGEAP